MRADRDSRTSENLPEQGVGAMVRRRRRELGLTLQGLAERAGCTKGYLSEIENGRRDKAAGAALLAQLERALGLACGVLAEAAAWEAAPDGLRRKIARAAGARQLLAGPARAGGGRSLDALYRSGVLGSLADAADLEGRAGAKKEVAAENVAAAALRGLVPIINAVAAGYPADFTDLGYPARVADDYLPAADVADADSFAARVVGDSMEPEYREGDIVVFSPARAVRDGDDCYARLESRQEATFKRVFFETGADGAELIHLRPLNGKYEARTVRREEVAGLYAAVSVTRPIVSGRGRTGEG